MSPEPRASGDHLLGWTSASLDDLHHLWLRGVLHVFACASVSPARSGGSASQCLAAHLLCRDELHSLRLHSGFFQISNLRPHRRRQISSFPRARDQRPNIEARRMGEDRIAHAGQNKPSSAEPIRRALHNARPTASRRAFETSL
jgi:hypothetical protein